MSQSRKDGSERPEAAPEGTTASSAAGATPGTPRGTAYQVMARKYRPETFADLVGQDAMVRTLKNAFAADRIAQAFILTGIRGTGKTSTARIIAKGLNCIGPDGQGQPTTEPCGQCEHCTAISEGRHVDVMEMDAASRTGVGDIREIIESVHYRAASARYKVYIIDEVHMLSTAAFNALLKTLEEPPAHVKFIFATTEIRKVPVTVLSRCQRFDLRRIEPEEMLALLRRIARAEGGQISDEALALIVRAAEGSARDATSLLDQALSHGAGETGAEQVRAMLGLADRGRVMDLFELIMKGDAAGALGELSAQYADGADPLAVLRDLAELTHWISVIKITPEAAEDPTVSPNERSRGTALAEALPMRALTRMWQMLLKAIEEVSLAPNAMMAAEMALIRLTHVADLPSPEELVRKLQDGPPPAPQPPGSDPGGPASGRAHQGAPAAAGSGAQGGAPPGSGPHGSGSRASASPGASGMSASAAGSGASGSSGPQAVALAEAPESALAAFPGFESVLALIRKKRDIHLLVDVEKGVRLASYSPGRIEFTPAERAAEDLAPRLARRLQEWTGLRWGVSIVSGASAPTIAETREADERRQKDEARANPLVRAVLEAFDGARITAVRPLAQGLADDGGEGVSSITDTTEEEDGEWDPFEED